MNPYLVLIGLGMLKHTWVLTEVFKLEKGGVTTHYARILAERTTCWAILVMWDKYD